MAAITRLGLCGAPRGAYPGFAPAGASALLTGTLVPTATETVIQAGGGTIVITIVNDTWVAAGAAFDAIRQDIINGLDSDGAEATGWNAVIRDSEAVTAVVRTSDTVVTITLTAAQTYDISATETITVTVPDTALTTSVLDVTATPTFDITAVAPDDLFDTHDGADERKRERFLRERDEEIRLQRERLRADLLAAVERATHKPPPLDAPLKQLAGMAKRAPGFDYPEAVAQIDEIQSQLLALQRLRESASIERAAESERDEQKRRKRRAEEELIIVTFLSS